MIIFGNNQKIAYFSKQWSCFTTNGINHAISL